MEILASVAAFLEHPSTYAGFVWAGMVEGKVIDQCAHTYFAYRYAH